MLHVPFAFTDYYVFISYFDSSLISCITVYSIFQRKTTHLIFYCGFGNWRPIVKTLSLTDSQRNSYCCILPPHFWCVATLPCEILKFKMTKHVPEKKLFFYIKLSKVLQSLEYACYKILQEWLLNFCIIHNVQNTMGITKFWIGQNWSERWSII